MTDTAPATAAQLQTLIEQTAWPDAYMINDALGRCRETKTRLRLSCRVLRAPLRQALIACGHRPPVAATTWRGRQGLWWRPPLPPRRDDDDRLVALEARVRTLEAVAFRAAA